MVYVFWLTTAFTLSIPGPWVVLLPHKNSYKIHVSAEVIRMSQNSGFLLSVLKMCSEVLSSPQRKLAYKDVQRKGWKFTEYSYKTMTSTNLLDSPYPQEPYCDHSVFASLYHLGPYHCGLQCGHIVFVSSDSILHQDSLMRKILDHH